MISMTWHQGLHLRKWVGLISIGALLLLAVVLQLRIAPSGDGFLPQTSLLGYSDARLGDFGAALAKTGMLAEYRVLLFWGDGATVVLFAWWIALSLPARWGMRVSGLYMLTEAAENAALLAAIPAVGLSAGDGGNMAIAAWFTMAKFAVALPVVACILLRDLRPRGR